METKQTAVEWLLDQVKFIDKEVYAELYNQSLEHAKQMDKEQKQEFYNEGKDFSSYTYDEQYGGVEYWDREPLGFEDYYNQTYNK
jgi:hypothetical protein